MGKQYMREAIEAAVRTFRSGHRSFRFHKITMKIEHAHSNQYQVLLPDGSELIRLIAGRTLQVLPV